MKFYTILFVAIFAPLASLAYPKQVKHLPPATTIEVRERSDSR